MKTLTHFFAAALFVNSMAMLAGANAAYASDRPFLQTSSAAAEEDDDGVWAVESWWQRSKSQHGLSVAAEYAFNPTTSLQLERSRVQARASSDKAHSFELEFKHLFNRIGRVGWGWGIDVSLGAATFDEAGWRFQRWSVKLPYTVALRDGDAMLHVNAGLQKQRDERREWVGSSAFEHKLGSRSNLFVELGREDRSTLLHAGVRHWLKRDKFAVDLSVQQTRSGGERERGLVIGFGWYDL